MVNTFYIDKDPKITAKILDDKRLGKQRVEAYQIIQVLQGEKKAGRIILQLRVGKDIYQL